MNHLDPMEAAVQLGLLVMEIHIGQKEYNEDTRMEMVRYAEIFLGPKAESEYALGFAVEAVERLETEKAEMCEVIAKLLQVVELYEPESRHWKQIRRVICRHQEGR